MISFKYIASRLPPAYAKIFFVSTWASFAYALYLLNRAKDRPIKIKVPDCPNVRAVLFFTGIIGGIFTGIAGSGLDICSFCVLIKSYKNSTIFYVSPLKTRLIGEFPYNSISLTLSSLRENCNSNICCFDGPNVSIWILV